MKTTYKFPILFTYKIKQSIYDLGTNLFLVEYYDSLEFPLFTLAIYIPVDAEPPWILQKVNELYDRFTQGI